MHFLSVLPALVGLAAALPAVDLNLKRSTDGPIVASPGPVSDMIVSKETTLNGTHHGPTRIVHPKKGERTIPLPLSYVNNFGSAINAYLVGNCPNNEVCFILGNGGIVYPSSGGSNVPVSIPNSQIAIPIAAGHTLNMNLPNPIESARIYFSAGNLQFGMVHTPNGDGLVQPAPNNPSDPSAGITWGFVELNVNSAGAIFANVSYVDFVGLVLGMQLTDNNGPTQTARGLAAGSANAVCSDLRAQQNTDGYPWGNMCMTNSNGAIVRVLSPNDYSDINSASFSNYWTNYVNSVYSHYSSTNLQMTTTCRASGNTLTCQGGDNLVYNKPSATDIWGCANGPFANTGNSVHLANLAILCAAFHRGTLLQSGGNVQPGSIPVSQYYSNNVANFFAKSVHAHELDGRGYAFPYDDVSPGTANTAGAVSSGNPAKLLIWIGGN